MDKIQFLLSQSNQSLVRAFFGFARAAWVRWK